jgi:hypothetical protein
MDEVVPLFGWHNHHPGCALWDYSTAKFDLVERLWGSHGMVVSRSQAVLDQSYAGSDSVLRPALTSYLALIVNQSYTIAYITIIFLT